MEKKKNQISTLLLVVGVIFILIAGSIFVTSAWKHLSETGKQMILTCVVAGLYVVTWKLREKGILTKAEHALYYLASAGTGFITVSFLGGWDTVNGYIDYIAISNSFNNADRAMWGLFAAGIGIAYRFFKERKVWDFGILTAILTVMFFLVFDASVNDLAGVIPLAALTLLVTFRYKETGHIGYRIAQSIGLLATNTYFVCELYRFMYDGSFDGDVFKWWLFAAFIIDIILMVLLERVELTTMVLAIGWLSVLCQIFEGFETWKHDNVHLYSLVPYGAVAAISLGIMWYREREDKYVKLAVIHGLMVLLEISLFALAKTEWFHSLSWDVLYLAAMASSVMFAFIFASVDSVLVNDTAKRIMKTFTLFFGELAALFLMATLDLDYFAVEVGSLFFGAGIVLLGIIWYDKAKGIRKAQFILTCVTLFVLLLHNLEVEELACLMFLGIAGIVMLVAAALKNHREYVIASSATLSLLALYLTREFWLSIEWWVYLFIAGVVLVGIAIKKEKEV